MQKYLAAFAVLAIPLFAGESSPHTVSRTERINAPAPGTIRFDNAYGEIEIEGWDQPDIEVTTTKWTEDDYAQVPPRIAQRLESVRIDSKRQDDALVISTTYPARNFFTHPLGRRGDVQLAYRIKAPRGTKIEVSKSNAGINIAGMTGDIHADIVSGEITLTLPEGSYDINAKCELGNVYSDFAGTSHRKLVLGEKFDTKTGPPSRNIFLRMRFGDIVILKKPTPVAG